MEGRGSHKCEGKRKEDSLYACVWVRGKGGGREREEWGRLQKTGTKATTIKIRGMKKQTSNNHERKGQGHASCPGSSLCSLLWIAREGGGRAGFVWLGT